MNTALHCACSAPSVQVASLLLQRGADVKITDNEGRTPFEVTSTNEVRKLFLMPRRESSVVAKWTNDNAPLSVETVPASCDSENKNEMVEDFKQRKEGAQMQNELQEQQQHKQQDEQQTFMCLVCMENKVNSIIFPCEHRVCCDVCLLKIDKCPLDRQPITNIFAIPSSFY